MRWLIAAALAFVFLLIFVLYCCIVAGGQGRTGCWKNWSGKAGWMQTDKTG